MQTENQNFLTVANNVFGNKKMFQNVTTIGENQKCADLRLVGFLQLVDISMHAFIVDIWTSSIKPADWNSANFNCVVAKWTFPEKNTKIHFTELVSCKNFNKRSSFRVPKLIRWKSEAPIAVINGSIRDKLISSTAIKERNCGMISHEKDVGYRCYTAAILMKIWV